MKKFYVTFCALALLFSVSANSQLLAPKQQKAKQLREQVSRSHDKRAVLDFSKIMKSNVKAPRLAVNSGLLKIRKAEAVDVTITDLFTSFYPDVNAIWYSLTPDEWSPSFSFSIYVPEGKRDVELGRTYTFADMEHDEYSNPNCWTDDDWEDHEIVEATFKKTVGTGYDIHIEGTATDVDGNSFTFHYDEEPIELKGEAEAIKIVSDRPYKEYLSDGTWMWRAGGEEYGVSVQLSYYCDDYTSPLGTFSGDDIDYTSSLINVWTDEYDEWGDRILKTLKVKDADITVTEDEAAFYIQGKVVCDDGYTYPVEITMNKPQALNQATIISTGLLADDYWFSMTGEVKFAATDGTRYVYITIYPEDAGSAMAGTYTIGQGGTYATVMPTADDEQVDAFSGTFDVTYNDGDITVKGKILCYNNTEYTLDLSYTKPKPTRQQTLTFDNLTAYYNWGDFEVFGYNSDQTQAIDLIVGYLWNMSGDFTEQDMELSYSFVSTDIDNQAQTSKNFYILMANIHSDFDGETGTFKITGTLLCQNADDPDDRPEFIIDLTARVPAPYDRDEQTDFNHNFEEYSVNDNFGMITVNAADGEAVVGLQFIVDEDETTLAPGVYTIDNTGDINTVTASSGMNAAGQLNYSLAGLVNDGGSLTNVWYLVSGTVTVDDNGVITVDAVNSNGMKVTSILGATSSGITAVTADDTKVTTVKFLKDGQIFIRSNNKVYDMQGVEVK